MTVNPLDLRVADLCAADYDGKAVPTWETPGWCRVFKHLLPDGLWIIFEGTRPGHPCDWMRDGAALFETRTIPKLGAMPISFWEDVMSVFPQIEGDVNPEAVVNVGGHSKGGSEGAIFAASWKLAGRKLGRVVPLEPAPVGPLGGFIADQPGLLTWVKRKPFLFDPVPDLPPGRAHPMPVTEFEAPAFTLNAIDLHELATVRAAMEAA